jgi:hypothetical protein
VGAAVIDTPIVKRVVHHAHDIVIAVYVVTVVEIALRIRPPPEFVDRRADHLVAGTLCTPDDKISSRVRAPAKARIS